MTIQAMAFVARMLLGSFYLMSGLNWVFGYIPILPHIGMPPDLPMRHEVVAEMVQTGWMYQTAKVLEIAAGLSLLLDRFAPLMLTVTAPVAFLTFVLGASLIVGDVAGVVMGTVPGSILLAKIRAGAIGGLSVMLIHIWLMLCYFDYYRPLLTARAVTKEIR
jgi:hypothetical protein